MGKTYAETINIKRDFEKHRFESLVNEFAKKGYLLKDLGEDKYHRYMFRNVYIKDDKILLSTNHAKDLEQLEKVLKLFKFNARTLPYETRLIELNYYRASDKEYSDLMTDMEGEFNIPLLNDPGWNEKNKDVIALYKSIANQRSFEEEQDDWELEP